MDRREHVRDCAATIAMFSVKQKRDGIFVGSVRCFSIEHLPAIDVNGVARCKTHPREPRENSVAVAKGAN